jgi:hypothetical protein
MTVLFCFDGNQRPGGERTTTVADMPATSSTPGGTFSNAMRTGMR